MAHPTVEAIPFIAMMVPYIGGIMSYFISGSRSIWALAYLWNNTWWIAFFYLFVNVFWLWVLDAWGWLEMDWFWQMFAPLDANGNYSIVDEWVEVNTWTMAYTVKVIEKESGKPWDANDLQHVQMMKDYTWAYLYEQMNLLNYITVYFWLTNTFWMYLCPTMYIDDEGYALDGYPLMMAKSYELSKMY